MPNPSEQFRTAMSQLADVSESADAAVAGFQALHQEQNKPLDEPAAQPEPESEETEPTQEDLKPAAEGDEAALAKEDDAPPQDEEPAGGDVVQLDDGTQVPVADLVKGHLRQADYTKKTMELATEKRELDQQREQIAAETAASVQQVTSLAQQLHAQLQRSQPTEQQMAELRQRDPAQAALVMEDQRRQRELIEAANQQAVYMQQQQAASVIPQQRALLAERLPAFEKDFDTEYQDLGAYAISPDGGGLQREEWDQLVDHRHVTLVWKAKQYDEATRKARTIPKKLPSNKPRVLRPGVQRDAGDTATEQYATALARQRDKGGDQRSTAQAFLAREQSRRAR